MGDGGFDAALEQIRVDPTLRAVVKAARAWGVSPSRFLGHEPTVTVVPDGPNWRVCRSPAWTVEDRELVLAYVAYEAQLCPGCSRPLDETTDPDNEGRYVTGRPVRCHHCAALAQAGSAYEDDPHPSTLLFSAELH